MQHKGGVYGALNLLGHACVSMPGAETSDKEGKYDITASEGWVTNTYMNVMNQCTQESIKVL